MKPNTLAFSACLALAFAACAKGNANKFGATTSTGDTGPTTTAASSSSSATQAASQSSSAVTSGAGGDMGTTTAGSGAGGAGGDMGTTVASSSSSSGSGGMGACEHDVCTKGVMMTDGCNKCVADVCANDSYCCDTEWDEVCVGETADYCSPNPMCSGGGGGGGGGSVGPGDLLVTEIMADPAKVADASGEWIEVYNTTKSSIDMKGLMLRHQDPKVDATAVEPIGKSLVVPAGGYVILGINADSKTNGGIKVDYQYSSKVNMSNTKDYVGLETADKVPVVIDVTTYDTAKLNVPAGKSRNLDPGFMSMADNKDDTHFCAAKTLIMGSTDYGTPGVANDKCK